MSSDPVVELLGKDRALDEPHGLGDPEHAEDLGELACEKREMMGG